MITGNLEYLISSLPYLSFQDSEEERLKVASLLRKYAGVSEKEKSLITILDDEAAKFLTPTASHLLSQINLNTIHEVAFWENGNKVLAAFSEYVFLIKEHIREVRISRRKHSDQTTSKKQSSLIISGDPLNEEIQLLKLKWNKLETLSIGHYTDFGALIIYKLKLLLLLRWWSFDMDKGFEVFLQTIKKAEYGR
ncbi:DUF2764 family protein [Flavivirga amylovorans]|uniref:DUF2764 family protein n=1 Tax=Flavivirga amylovorans TaxID=870486 RepID=A0ABT8WZC6_9FLAO|nr:DUF2764 family protein [Flavivirga amylovorans]MDO5986710.1 DUF2764 family protein [Flavivirga amylovorans]